ncbi:MAG: citrate synthase [Chitinophagaceae bacterium]|nr:citrate synthase [Chitinophagaceae bacterium]
MPNTAELIYNGKTYSFPVLEGTEKEIAVDISKLREQSAKEQTPIITMDPGYKNTGATTSAITFLDGEQGILQYRGYPIEELAEKSSFLEVAYLLIFGELPTESGFSLFKKEITEHTLVHEDIKKILEGFPAKSHPMGVLGSLVCALSTFYPESLNKSMAESNVHLQIIRLLAKFPTLAAWSYKNEVGHPVVYPDNKLSYCQNLLKMMFSLPTESYSLDPVVVDALDKLLILHADHEQNCSTSTVRMVGSSRASIYASISAGINALWGPLHGGANQEVMEMLELIKQDGGNVKKYVEKAKSKEDPFLLMGFGHRVYKNFDPRAKIIKKAADDVLNKLKINDPILEIAKELEAAALKDQYFIDKKLYPNVDFYSGIIYKAMGIPTEMFTVFFSMGRLPGWIAQWKEMRENKEPIGRPRQIYTGKTKRSYIPINKR